MQIDTLGHLSSQDRANICFAFENTACKHILNKLEIIFKERNFKHFGVVGGASANIKLRAGLNTMCKKFNCELLVAPLDFCSDNAAMIARAGREKYLRGDFINQDKLNINPRSSFDRI